ncbi:REX1B protein, partial [Toxostoma redivivum]|nr:REX1B protein [Toxostoma redivivum]
TVPALPAARYRVTGATGSPMPPSPCVPQTGETVRELLQRLRALQSERVETYRLFEEQENAPGAACGVCQRGLGSGLGVVTVASPPSPVRRGHQAYLSSAPHYDFPRYRQLVHEVTVAFSGISREVLDIAGRLRDRLGRPDLAQHLARLQEREQEKLQLVGAGLGGGGPWGSAGAVSIRSRRLIKTIEAISEILQDLKYDSEEVE